uniref:Photolyase/cryptochrome alpha/beta domain-containing protein n=1 Tax=Caenorhabditis tropicalis TaxID=1561998 RepID=A0A1I7SY31_9PELO
MKHRLLAVVAAGALAVSLTPLAAAPAEAAPARYKNCTALNKAGRPSPSRPSRSTPRSTPPTGTSTATRTAWPARRSRPVTTLVWFRDDLRTADHPALAAAAEDPEGMVLLFVLDEQTPGARPLGGAARWWLHGSLAALQRELADRGVPLVLRRGTASAVIPEVVAECGITRVVWNRRYGEERHADAELKASLRRAGIDARSFVGGVLHEPGTILNGEGRPYRVY